GLSLAGVLPPEDILALLTQRCVHLEFEISQMRSLLQLVQERGLRRVHVIESEYTLAMREAELAWTRWLIEAITSGRLGDRDEWAATQRAMDEQSRASTEAGRTEAGQEED